MFRYGRAGPTLSEQLNHIAQLDDDNEELIQLLKVVMEEEQAAVGFRWQAPSSQKRQNRILAKYLECVQGFLLRAQLKDCSDDEVRKAAFPSDINQFSQLLRGFLMFVFLKAKTGTRIKYRSLAQYREAMLFWSNHIFTDRNETPPSKVHLFNKMTQAMQHIQQKFADPNAKKVKKSFLGLDELRQLIDYEMINNTNIANSEQHQLAWCLGRMLAVRPGTLCPGPYGRNKPLCWNDITITKCDDPGHFNVNVEFVNISIKISNNPEHEQDEHPLNVTIKSASSHEDLIFSPSHRLLVIALRRGLLKDISTLDELLDTQLRIIEIKPEHRDQPIFVQSTPKGTSLNFDKPLRAASLTEYLRNRSLALGYPNGISFYSIRRKIATDLVRRVGLETARNMMGHAPESHTLERYYLSLGPTLDVQAISTEAPIQPGGVSDELVATWAPFAQGRLSDAGIQKTRGAALKAYAAKLMEMDPAYPQDASIEQLKTYRKKVRRRAHRDLMDQERVLERSKMTRAEFRDRLGATKASSFAKAVLDRAAQSVQALADTDADVDMDDDVEETDGLHGEDDSHEEDAGEVDLEDAAVDAGTRQLSLDVEHDEDNGLDVSTVPFKEVAKSFMGSLLHNTMSKVPGSWAQGEQRCLLCVEDETASPAERNKKWDKEAKLRRHQETSFHTSRRQWERRITLQHDAVDPEGPWYCPYCPESGQNGFGRLNELITHLKKSKKTDLLHERLKAEDGWMEEDFSTPRLGTERARSQERHVRRVVKEAGFNFVHEPPELPMPVPFTASATPHTFLRGGPSVFTDIPPGTKPGMMAMDYNNLPPGVEADFPSSTREFMGWDSDTVPPRLRNFMEVVETPKPFTEMWDEESKAKDGGQERRGRQ